MKNYTTKEFLRIRNGYEKAEQLYLLKKYKPAITALKRPIQSLEYGSEKTIFLAKCYKLLSQCYEGMQDHEKAEHYEKESQKIVEMLEK